ncbi:spp-4 [Pristionchus pacificus]|uniref:Saposin B-type domain-containing protein n=1 Tax=Pristionchus pacificus TaxID=54126 RepID=A0A454Y717_PRIPA|nr:spp-4 [Pristionchus pacificus]|eukprot:PDM78197.1 hypothetical protein PRIPAC_30776 [Pristionchus pacificus]
MFRSLIVYWSVFALAIAASAADNNYSAVKQLIPQLPQNRNHIFCNDCYEMINIIEQTWLVDEPGMKTRLDNWCDTVYGHMAGMDRECKQWIDEDLDTASVFNIVTRLQNGWSAEAICKDLHMC